MSQVSAAADTRYRIRAAQREDLPAIVAIYNATIPSRMVTADLVPVSVNDRLPWFEAHSSATRPIWVACANSSDEIAAWLSFDTFYPRAAYDGTAMLALYVAESHCHPYCFVFRELIGMHKPMHRKMILCGL